MILTQLEEILRLQLCRTVNTGFQCSVSPSTEVCYLQHEISLLLMTEHVTVNRLCFHHADFPAFFQLGNNCENNGEYVADNRCNIIYISDKPSAQLYFSWVPASIMWLQCDCREMKCWLLDNSQRGIHPVLVEHKVTFPAYRSLGKDMNNAGVNHNIQKVLSFSSHIWNKNK